MINGSTQRHGQEQDERFDKEIGIEEQNIYKNQLEDHNMNSFKNTNTYRS